MFTAVTLILFFSKLCYCQDMLTAIQADSRISQFYQILQTIPNYATYFQNTNLCAVIPSNRAMAAFSSTGANVADIVKRHMFDSKVNFLPVQATVSSWNQFKAYTTKTGNVYGTFSIQGAPLYLDNSQQATPTVNGANVIFPNIICSNNQVYHIIDRVLFEGSDNDFLAELASDATLSTSFQMWSDFKTLAISNQLNGISSFASAYIAFSNDLTGTILVPNNDAWATMAPTDITAFKSNATQFNNVMARFYISSRMVFIHGRPVAFKAGFGANPLVDGVGNIDGNYFRDSGADMVNVQGYVGKIIRPNIPMRAGVIHVISSPLTIQDTRFTYLQRNAPGFLAAIMSDAYLTSLLNGNNTILAANNKTMAAINQMDPATRNLTLINSFIIGVMSLAQANNTIVTTAANVSVKVSSMGSNRLSLDTVASLTDRTYTSKARVLKMDYAVDGVSINIISGTIGNIPYSCSDMLLQLNITVYKSLVDSLSITLGLGSPYTLFVPDDNTLNQFINGTANMNTMTTAKVNLAMSSPTPASNIATTNNSISNNSSSGSSGGTGGTSGGSTGGTSGGGTGGTSGGSNGGSGSSRITLRYLIQRMIIANKLVLATKAQGNFKAATMNYAAMQEMLDMVINSDSTVSIGIFGVSNIRPYVDGGYYCYSNSPPQPDRLNLIYPVNFVLTTPKDSSLSICVTAPCSGCMSKWSLVVVTLGSLLLMFHREG